MPLSTKALFDSANSTAKGAASKPVELLQASAIDAAVTSTVVSVPTYADLPSAAENKGRMIWVTALDEYWYSDGNLWVNDLSTQQRFVNTLWGWGVNANGQIGINDTFVRSSPVLVVGGFTDWCQISAGCRHTLAVRNNGTIWAWGCNDATLGDNTTINKSSPVSVVGGFTDWCKVSASAQYHTAAIRANGTLWTWGVNTAGRLGDNTTTNRSSPVSVVGGFTDWCQVSAGNGHSAAVRTNGTIWSWGRSLYGELGDNSTVSKSSPVSVVGGFTDWCQVSAGASRTIAVRSNGTLWAWGNNSGGKLGDNSTVSKSSPVSVVGGFTDWCQVSAGGEHSAAVRTNGTIWSWGNGNNGRLGNNSTIARSSPVSVVGGFTDWCQVSAGESHSVGIRTNGTLWSWGYNNNGQLGDGTVVSKCSPVPVNGGFTDWCSTSAWLATLAIRKQSVGF